MSSARAGAGLLTARQQPRPSDLGTQRSARRFQPVVATPSGLPNPVVHCGPAQSAGEPAQVIVQVGALTRPSPHPHTSRSAACGRQAGLLTAPQQPRPSDLGTQRSAPHPHTSRSAACGRQAGLLTARQQPQPSDLGTQRSAPHPHTSRSRSPAAIWALYEVPVRGVGRDAQDVVTVPGMRDRGPSAERVVPEGWRPSGVELAGLVTTSCSDDSLNRRSGAGARGPLAGRRRKRRRCRC